MDVQPGLERLLDPVSELELCRGPSGSVPTTPTLTCMFKAGRREEHGHAAGGANAAVPPNNRPALRLTDALSFASYMNTSVSQISPLFSSKKRCSSSKYAAKTSSSSSSSTSSVSAANGRPAVDLKRQRERNRRNAKVSRQRRQQRQRELDDELERLLAVYQSQTAELTSLRAQWEGIQ
jgi:hypothetical protein